MYQQFVALCSSFKVSKYVMHSHYVLCFPIFRLSQKLKAVLLSHMSYTFPHLGYLKN